MEQPVTCGGASLDASPPSDKIFSRFMNLVNYLSANQMIGANGMDNLTNDDIAQIVRNMGGLLNICNLINKEYCQKHMSQRNINNLERLLLLPSISNQPATPESIRPQESLNSPQSSQLSLMTIINGDPDQDKRLEDNHNEKSPSLMKKPSLLSLNTVSVTTNTLVQQPQQSPQSPTGDGQGQGQVQGAQHGQGQAQANIRQLGTRVKSVEISISNTRQASLPPTPLAKPIVSSQSSLPAPISSSKEFSNGTQSSIQMSHSQLNRRRISFAELSMTDMDKIVSVSITRWEDFRPVFKIDASHNMYFKCLPHNIASWIYYKILRNKWYIISLVIMVLITMIQHLIHISTRSCDIYCLSWEICCYSYVILFTISYILSINFDLIIRIFQSFDYWFKMYNLIILVITDYINFDVYKENANNALSQNVITETMLTVGYILVFLAVFAADAIFMPFKLKMSLIGLIVVSTMIGNMYVFFSIDDTVTRWNPLANILQNNSSWHRYSTINFKSLEMSALSNLSLFSAKPLFTIVWKKFRLCMLDLDESEEIPERPRWKLSIILLKYSFVLFATLRGWFV